MEIYREKIKLDREVPTSRLVRIMQDVGGQHNRSNGLSRQVLRDKGLFWIIVSNYIELERYPDPGEELEITTWRGKRKRTLLPRYLVAKDREDKVVFRGSAFWAMLNAESHKMANPVKYGLSPAEAVTGEECRLPAMIKKKETTHDSSFIVPEEYIDTNNHMNNTYYFDVCERCLRDELNGRKLKEATIDYVSEAKLGEKIKLSWAENGDKIYVQGEKQNTIFRTNLRYV